MRKTFLILLTIAPMLAILASAFCSCNRPGQHQQPDNIGADTTMELDSSGLLWVIARNPNGDTLGAQSYIVDTTDNSIIAYSAYENTYDSHGRLSSRILYMVDPADIKLKPLEITSMDYDSIGNIAQILQKTFNHESGRFINSTCRMYSYTDTTKVFESSYIWQADQERWLEVSARYYEYDTLGRLMRSLIHEIDPNDTSKVIKRLME